MYPVSNVWLVWDKRLDYPKPNPRQVKLEGGYKEGRDKEEASNVFEHGDTIAELTEKLGVRNFYPKLLEADDCIAWLSRVLDESVIFTADTDMLQLVTEKCSYYSLTRKKLFTLENFEETFGCTPEEYTIFKCVKGDTSDKITGVPGYGDKKSLKVAKQYGKVNLEAEVEKVIKENYELIDLRHDNFIDAPELDWYLTQKKNLEELYPNFDVFQDRLKEMKLRTHLKKINAWKDLFERQANSDLVSILSKLEVFAK